MAMEATTTEPQATMAKKMKTPQECNIKLFVLWASRKTYYSPPRRRARLNNVPIIYTAINEVAK